MTDRIRVGINGFGRIGRQVARLSLQREDIEIVHINDLAPVETMAHLLKFDSVHGPLWGEQIDAGPNELSTEKWTARISSESIPDRIDWKSSKVDVVIESTGAFRTMDDCRMHLSAGAPRVLLSAPPASKDIPMVVLGVQEEALGTGAQVLSNASCTTNCAAPMIEVLRKHMEIESAYITTVHSYTTDQRLHDAPHKDLRRGRAAAESIVPTTTGAAKAITQIFPELSDRIGGCGIRVPVPDGSLTDISLVTRTEVDVERINAWYQEAADSYLRGIMGYTTLPIVSKDIVGLKDSCLIDSQLTSVVGNMVKVVGWYDNEVGYSSRLLDLLKKW